MTIHGSKKQGVAILCGIALFCFGYSLLALAPAPAFAAVCSPSDCAISHTFAESYCEHNFHGTLVKFECPIPGEPDYWGFECEDGFSQKIFCEN
jgi:hypothetical protein